MTKNPAKQTRLYIDQYEFASVLNAVDMDVTQELPVVTCLSDAGPRVLVGNYGHKHNLRGFFVSGSTEMDQLTHSMLASTADRYLAEMYAGTAEGVVAYESIAHPSGKPIRVAVGGAVLQELPMEGAGGMVRGMVLRNATLGASDTGTAIDQGANTAGTYRATFRFSSGVYTNCVLQVQDSSNNTTWGNSTGLTATSTGNSKIVVAETQTALRQYKRVIATTMAGGTDAGVLVIGGVVVGTT